MNNDKKKVCPECGIELGEDGRCYNSHCSEWDPLSQYDTHEIQVNAAIDEIVNKHGVTREDIRKELELGTTVELEHTDDRNEAEFIALDHLDEHPDYYTYLSQMEKEMEDPDPEPKLTTDPMAAGQ